VYYKVAFFYKTKVERGEKVGVATNKRLNVYCNVRTLLTTWTCTKSMTLQISIYIHAYKHMN